MTIIAPDLRSKIERRSSRAWRRLRDGNAHRISRISDLTDRELKYRLPNSPSYYGAEKVRVVKHKDGTIEVDPKTTGLIDCKTKEDLDKLQKHGGTVRAYIVTKQDAKAASKVLKLNKDYKLKSDDIRGESRAQCLERVNPGDRVFVVELHADDIEKHGYGNFKASKISVVDELDPTSDLGFTTGLIDCKTAADLDKLKKHIGKVRGYVLKKREKRILKLKAPHTLKTGERYQSLEAVKVAARPGDKAYAAEFDYSDITKHHTDGVDASAVLVEELDPVKDLGFTVGTMLDMVKNSDLKKLAKHVGMIRGYKYVTQDLKSPAQTGANQITYKVGEEFEIPNANTNPKDTCAAGINIATQEWCKGSSNVPPDRLLAFEFHSKAIAAIPTDGGKMRVFRCLCVEELDASFNSFPKPKKAVKEKKEKKGKKEKGKKKDRKDKKKKGLFGKFFGGE